MAGFDAAAGHPDSETAAMYDRGHNRL